MTIATPSAKSHERVTGRWVRDIEVKTRAEWTVYYAKVIFGTPVPWLMWAFVCLAFLSRAGVEIAAWSSALLTLLYICADRFSSTREFRFFRVGCDFFLFGYVVVTILTAANSDTTVEAMTTLGGARWVLLLYLLSYCWELFPGLNRLFALMAGAAVFAGVYGVWQHFTGVDLLNGSELPPAPVPGAVFFTPHSFFNTPEILGTLLALALPFPVATYLFAGGRDGKVARYFALGTTLFLVLAVLWTYRPGLWFASLGGLVVVVLLQARRAFGLLLMVTAFVAIVFFVSYGSPDAMLNSVQVNETQRADRQRAQINTEVELWQQAPWIGSGTKAMDAANYDSGTGNVYFLVLAQSGVLGLSFYFLFVLGFLLATYRIFQEIPASHYWHRVLTSGAMGGQIAFHIAGLYWATLGEALVLNLFILMISSISYLSQHYSRGLVTDDYSL